MSNSSRIYKMSLDILENITLPDIHHEMPAIHRRFRDDCNELCISYIYNFLNIPKHSNCSEKNLKNELINRLKISSNFSKFIDYMIKILKDENIIIVENGEITNCIPFKTTLSINILKERYPMFLGTLSLLEHCVANLERGLSESISAISILFPNGNTKFIDETLSKDSEEYSGMSINRKIAVELISRISKQTRVKILEIGGGRGIITKELLKYLRENNLIEYTFTDISKRFVIDMKRYAESKNYTFVKCNTFDITKNPLQQGFKLEDYDIVIGLDVVHATSDIMVGLKIIKSLINSDGLLFLLETTTVPYWQNIIMGITKGWWVFNDKWRIYQPLLASEKWVEALKGCEFEKSSISSCNTFDSTLIIATKGILKEKNPAS
jgi:2-polyprenyl-3-methyl-5-hydroxy-6-metoxy-1,4-benzoquinol methylase